MVASKKNRMNKTRRNKNRRCWSRRQRGGMAPVNDSSMALGQKDSLAQGQQFLSLHKAQHGGMSPYPLGVTDSRLAGPMVAAARTGPLDTAISQIQGMKDGGRRYTKSRKTKKTRSKKARSKKTRSKKHRGGAHAALGGSPLSENSMLLPSGLEKQAALNSDWDAARNPNYWAPKQ